MNKKSIMPRAMKKRNFYCSCCGEKLIPYPKTRIVKRGDPDHKEHSYFGQGKRLIGDIELTEYDFKCLSCEKFTSFDEQCVIEEIQKYVGSHILSQDNINENFEKATATLNQKRRIKAIISKLFGLTITILVIYYCLKSGGFSFKVLF